MSRLKTNNAHRERYRGNYSGKQMGFSLVELMIAATIGLAFGSMAITSLVNSRTSFEHRNASARVIENGRMAVDELTAMIRMAGYYDPLAPGTEVPVAQVFTGACGSFKQCTGDGTGTESDQIAFLMNPPPDDGSETDCVGNPVHEEKVIAARSVVAYLFLITEDDDGHALSCQTFLVDKDGIAEAINKTPQKLVPGIESMQILYGKTDIENMRDRDTQLSFYASAEVISAMKAPEGGSTPWIDLASVRFALLVNAGEEDTSQELEKKAYQLLDGPELVRADRKLRHIFSSTVLVNNGRY